MSDSMKRVLLCLFIALAAGCATSPPATPPPGTGQPTRTTIPIPSALPWTPVSAALNPDSVSHISRVGSLPGHSTSVNSYVFAHKKSLMATRDGVGKVFVWDLEIGRLLFKIELLDSLNMMLFTPDDSQLVTTGVDGQIRIFNATSGKQESAVTGDAAGISAAVSAPDGGALFFIGAGGAITGWRPATGRGASFVIPPVKNTHPLNLTVSPDGKLLAALQEYGAVTLYDAVTGSKLRESKLFPEIVQNIGFSPDGLTLAVSLTQTVYTLNVADLSERFKLYDLYQSAERGFIISPDSQMMAVNGREYVFVWNLNSGHQIARLPNHPDGASGIGWSPDGKLLATIGYGKRGGAYLWDVSSFATTDKVRQGKVAKGEDEMFNLAWSPDGHRLITSNIYGTMFVWGTASR